MISYYTVLVVPPWMENILVAICVRCLPPHASEFSHNRPFSISLILLPKSSLQGLAGFVFLFFDLFGGHGKHWEHLGMPQLSAPLSGANYFAPHSPCLSGICPFWALSCSSHWYPHLFSLRPPFLPNFLSYYLSYLLLSSSSPRPPAVRGGISRAVPSKHAFSGPHSPRVFPTLFFHSWSAFLLRMLARRVLFWRL